MNLFKIIRLCSIVAVLLIGAMISGCGLRGTLYLPDDVVDNRSTDVLENSNNTAGESMDGTTAGGEKDDKNTEIIPDDNAQ